MALSATLQRHILSAENNAGYTPFQDVPLPEDNLQGGLASDWLEFDNMRSGHVQALLEKRERALIARDWRVEPASEDERDVDAANCVTEILKRFDFDGLCFDLQEAIFMGLKPGEVGYTVANDGLIIPAYAYGRPQWQIGFRKLQDNDFNYREDRTVYKNYEVRQVKFWVLEEGEPIPDRRVIIHSRGSHNGNPWGRGLKKHLYWPLVFIAELQKQMLIFGDKFASPTPIGYFPANDPNGQKVLGEFLDSITQGAWSCLPQGYKVELLESLRATGDNFYTAAIKQFEYEASRLILGETGTSDQSGSTGSFASHKVADDIRIETAMSDAYELASTLNNSLIKWLSWLNRPDAQQPNIWWVFGGEEDLKSVAERDKLLFDMGWRPSEKRIKTVYGDDYEPVSVGTFPTAAPIIPRTVAPQFGALIHQVIRLNGMGIGLEYIPGQVRFPGRRNSRKLRSGYGHLRNYTGVDKEAMDCYVSSDLVSAWQSQDDEALDSISRYPYFEVTQLVPDSGEFDEVKIMLGYPDLKQAESAYLQEMPEDFYGGIRRISQLKLDEHKQVSSTPVPENIPVVVKDEDLIKESGGRGFAAKKR